MVLLSANGKSSQPRAMRRRVRERTHLPARRTLLLVRTRGPRSQALPPRDQPPPQFVPVHAATEDLRPQRIREWAWQACRWAPNVVEGLPAELRARRGLAGVGRRDSRRPLPGVRGGSRAAARERLAFEELFLHQAILATRKRTHRIARPAPRFGKPGEMVGPLDRLAAVRADRRPARRASTRSTPTSTPASRCSGC